jgi:hypothetical protein
MRNKMSFCSEAFRLLIAPILVISFLILPFTIAEAQRDRQKAQPTTSQPGSSDQSHEGKTKLTVVRRVNQARVTPSVAKAIASTPALRHVLSVQGTLIKPTAGNSLLQVEGGGYIAVGGTVEANPSEAKFWALPGGIIHFTACWCPNLDGADDCRFDGSPTRGACKGQGCCAFAEGDIYPDGSVKTY